jgi:hypothetical protein
MSVIVVRAPIRQHVPDLADRAVDLGDPLDVDDDLRPKRPVTERMIRSVPAGQHARAVRRVLREQRDSVVEMGGRS